MIHPKEALLDGAETLQVLTANGFRFYFRGEGSASGGPFAWGEFKKADRRLELHFRFTLGLVTYHVAEKCARHETYMRELSVWEKCQYPGFSTGSLSAFEGLAHDLSFAEDFLSGSAEALQRAAARESEKTLKSSEHWMAEAVGDTRRIQQMRDRLREHRYRDVLQIASELKYPEWLSDSQLQMIEIARSKMNKQTN